MHQPANTTVLALVGRNPSFSSSFVALSRDHFAKMIVCSCQKEGEGGGGRERETVTGRERDGGGKKRGEGWKRCVHGPEREKAFSVCLTQRLVEIARGGEGLKERGREGRREEGKEERRKEGREGGSQEWRKGEREEGGEGERRGRIERGRQGGRD